TLLASFIAIGGSILVIFNLAISKPLEALIIDIKKITPKDELKYRLPVEKKLRLLDVRQALNELLDITFNYQNQVKIAMADISLSNQKYNLLLESASDFVFQIGLDKRFKEAYGKGLMTLDNKKVEFVGKTFGEVFGMEVAEEREKQYDQALTGKKVYYTWKYVVDEELTYFETVISPLRDVNEVIIGAVGVTRNITEQQIRYERMQYVSTHDYLTDLYNRKFYIESLERLDSWKQYPFGVVNLDLNGLKIINDAYGHSYGDIALNKTAEVLLKICKENYIVSRVGGDEFTIIVPNATEDLIRKLKGKLIIGFSRVRISNLSLSVAVGYYIKTDDSIDNDEVRKLAENNMYRQKISERRSVKNKAITAILKTLTEKFSAEKVHSEKVAEYSFELGKALNLEKDDLRDLKTAGLFHDIGKISIPDNIINKPGKLTDSEYEIMKSHTEVGYEILRAADEYSDLAVHASSHHERYDGKGYPRGQKGEDIPLFSRIICIADAYEAMTSDRPYRKGNTVEYAACEIIKFAGTQFDPKLAKVFVEKVLKREWKIYNEKSDE
ncbi:MAG: diguanylate cyclase, partial [Tenericutes bacterium]|nr:diguanylate cyclase [Mycoplasmatota bacterium]